MFTLRKSVNRFIFVKTLIGKETIPTFHPEVRKRQTPNILHVSGRKVWDPCALSGPTSSVVGVGWGDGGFRETHLGVSTDGSVGRG